MKIIPIGCGNAFTMKDYQTNLLIEHNGKRLLIDNGTDARFALRDLGLTYSDIDAVYVSHLHADHIGGTEWLGFCSYFDPNKDKITLYGHQKVIEDAWSHAWKAGMQSIQGKVIDVYDFFRVEAIADNGFFQWEGIIFNLVQSVHIMNGYTIVPSYGLMINLPQSTKKIYFTSDTQFNPNQIQDFYNQADTIIQDCETSPYSSGVHAHQTELITLPPKTKKKMMLVHRQDNMLVPQFNPDNSAILEAAKILGVPKAKLLGVLERNFSVLSDEAKDWAKKNGFKGFAETGVEIKF